MRESSSGPISLTVVRIGWPFAPHRSQKITGEKLQAVERLDVSLDSEDGADGEVVVDAAIVESKED